MISDASMAMLHVLNIAFFTGHTAFIVFNLTGWAFQRTRKLHLLCLGATMFSWFVMGAVKGMGYCLCTDWHFQIRRQLSLPVNVHSYIQLMAEVFFGLKVDRMTSDVLAGGGLLVVLVITLIAWTRRPFQNRSTT